MTTFSVRFLGCKVSHTDAQEVRERLLADGHVEHGPGDAEVAVVNTCCVTHEAVRKSRQAAVRAARTHERVYVTGCAANLAPKQFEDPQVKVFSGTADDVESRSSRPATAWSSAPASRASATSSST